MPARTMIGIDVLARGLPHRLGARFIEEAHPDEQIVSGAAQAMLKILASQKMRALANVQERACCRQAEARQEAEGGKMSEWPLEDRKQDFELALLDVLETRSGGDQTVKVREVFTTDEVEHLASFFWLKVTADGEVLDALQ
jgi:hypothetical protein